MSDKTNLLGAFSPFTCKITKDEKAVFNEATERLLGVKYTPVAVSVQVVAGTNYRFFCNAELVNQYPTLGAAVVSIYRPLKGAAHITGISNVK